MGEHADRETGHLTTDRNQIPEGLASDTVADSATDEDDHVTAGDTGDDESVVFEETEGEHTGR